jgi:hypothetical protein
VNPALTTRVWDLAGDVGRLRRRVEPDSSLAYLCDRIAGHVESLHCILTPSAGELVAFTAPGDEDAIAEALRVVDDRWHRLQSRLGRKAAP